jgi:hypothetical protein
VKLFFEKDFFAVYVDESDEIIIAEWKIPPTSQEFRNGLDVMIDALQFFDTGKIVFDASALGILLESDQDWISSDWYGRAIVAGYSQVAFVLPTDILTNMCERETVKLTAHRIPTAYFNNMSAAIDWINKF